MRNGKVRDREFRKLSELENNSRERIMVMSCLRNGETAADGIYTGVMKCSGVRIESERGGKQCIS